MKNIDYPIEILANKDDRQGYPGTINEIIFFPERVFTSGMVIRIEFPQGYFVYFEKKENKTWRVFAKNEDFKNHLLRSGASQIEYQTNGPIFKIFQTFYLWQNMVN